MDFIFVIIGSFLGAVGYIAAHQIFRQRLAEVWAIGVANGSLAFCLGMLVCKLVELTSGLEQDIGMRLAISFTLAMIAPWLTHKAGPNIAKKLLSSLTLANVRALVMRILNIPSDKK